MNCEKCSGGQMAAEKIFKMSGCLVAIGFTLLVPAALAILIATGIAVLGTAATGSAAVETNKIRKEATLQALGDLKGDVTAVTNDYSDDGIVKAETLDVLEPGLRRDVDAILLGDAAVAAGGAIGTGVAATMGGAFVLMMYVLSIPALIVGFLLILKRKVWKCTACGYIYDRA